MTLLLRNLAGFDRRLWPLAAALVAAIAAVPLVLVGGSATRTAGESAPAPAKPSAAAHSAAGPQVHLDTAPAPGVAARHSKARNPFTSHAMPKDPAAAPAAAAPAPAPVAAPAASSPSQGAATNAPAATVTKPATGPAVQHRTAAAHATAAKYRVAWRWGVDGSQVGNHDVARLTALPSPHAPALIFLGLLKRSGGMAAMFLVEPGAQLEGDGRCLPDPGACHVLKLRAHQSELVTVGAVRYRLDLAHVQRGHVTPAAAKRARLRESHAGRKALRAAIDARVRGVGEFVFDRAKGLLAPYVPGAKS